VSSVVNITLSGLPATVRKLQALPDKIQRRAVGKAVRAGTRPLVIAARKNAPRSTGIFRASLDVKIKSYKSGTVQIGIVGQKTERAVSKMREIMAGKKLTGKLGKGRGGISGGGDLVPVHFIEEGTKPHIIGAERLKRKQVATTKAWRDAQRAKGLDPRAFRTFIVQAKPIVLRNRSGQVVFVGAVNHPGTRAEHPIRRAADEKASEAANRFAEKLESEVNAEAIKLATGI
jgi:hypothetical protein